MFLHVRFVHVAFGCRIYVCPVVCPQRSIRCADAIIEWGLLSQVPKPAKLLNAGGVSRSADRDEGAALDLQAFEKA